MRSTLLPVALLAAVAACAHRGAVAGEGELARVPRPAATATADSAGPPVIQVRRFPSASVVSVLGWDENEPFYGLRAEVNQAGDRVGPFRRGDHWLYLNTTLVENMGRYLRATADHDILLPSRGMRRDEFACNLSDACAPATTVAVRMPDSLLRAAKDSVVVTFYSPSHDDWTVSLPRELISRYLAVVDSVSASRRRR